MAEQLFENEAEGLVRKAIELGLAGDSTAFCVSTGLFRRAAVPCAFACQRCQPRATP
jgi:hypothetical protein